jgi:hypothetical protein
MTRDEFNRTAQDQVCVSCIHLKKDAFGQSDIRDQVATFALEADAWSMRQEPAIRDGILAITRDRHDVVEVVGTGRALSKLDEAFAGEIGYTSLKIFNPPPERPARRTPGIRKA